MDLAGMDMAIGTTVDLDTSVDLEDHSALALHTPFTATAHIRIGTK